MKKKELTDKINSALEKIRPFLAADEGDIQLVNVTKDNDVIIKMLGACSSCQFVDMTIQNGVEEYIRREAPEVRKIIPIESIQDIAQ